MTMVQTASDAASAHTTAPAPAPGDGLERESFLDAMRLAATGVTVVTTSDGCQRLGMTVSAMSSVSADPPLLLICVNRRSPVAAAIERNGIFCVNLLSQDQRQVSDVFAGRVRTETGDRFACGGWLWRATGAPVLVGAAAHFDCRLEASYDHGSHRIFVGRVVEARAGRGAPLVYCDRGYARVAAA
ncbi:MAG: flavin reductase family protein [Kiloniellales bacterium]